MIEQAQNQYNPDYAVPPGDVLQDNLDFQGMSQTELASRIGISKKTVNEIIKGKAPILPETALRLSKAVGHSDQFWNNLEQRYREKLAQLAEQDRLRGHLDWLKQVPVRAMVHRRYIQAYRDKIDQLNEVLKFFGIASPEQWQDVWGSYKVAYRQSRDISASEMVVSAWLRQGEIQAKSMVLSPYDKDKFSRVLDEIRQLTQEAKPEVFVPSLQKICAESGVAVVFVPELPKMGIFGATRWLGGNPLIQLSLRYKSNDHLWFTFFHEAGHILKHGRKEIFLESKGGMSSDKEEEADRFARDKLIPSKDWKAFIDSHNFTQEAIMTLASAIKIAPGIIVGRLQHDGYLKRNQANNLKVYYQWANND